MNRIIYSANTIFASDSPAFESQTGLFQLKLLDRIQDASVSVSNNILRSRQIGYDKFLFDNFSPTAKINCEITYYLSDSSNEAILGLNVENGCIYANQQATGIDKNLFFISDVENGKDVSSLSNLSGAYVFGVGNAFVNRYSIRGGVNEIPSATISFDANNIFYDIYTGNNKIPSLDVDGHNTNNTYQITSGIFNKQNYVTNQSGRLATIRPSDIRVVMAQPSLAGGFYQTVTGKIQSFNIDIPFERKELVGFGSNFAFDRKLMIPSVGTVSFNALFDNIDTGNYSSIFDFDDSTTIYIQLGDCDGNNKIQYTVENAKLVSESFNFLIGKELSFDGSFEFEINKTNGFKINGTSRLYDVDAVEFLEVASITDARTRESINTFVTEIKNYDLWNKMSGIYPFVGSSSGSFVFNLKDPRNDDEAFRLKFYNTNSASFTSSGINLTGSSDYADTFFNPYLHLTGLPIHLSFLSLTDVTSADFDIGCMQNSFGNPRLLVNVESNNSGIFDCYDFTTGRASITNVASSAFYTASRTSQNSGFLLLFNSSTTPTKSIRNIGNISGQQKPNLNVYFGTANNAGTPVPTSSNRRFGFFSFGDGLTSGDSVNLYSAVKNLQFNLGRNQSVFI